MVKITTSQLSVFMRILEDEINRYNAWIVSGDYVSQDELNIMKDEFLSLCDMLTDLSDKKTNILKLVE